MITIDQLLESVDLDFEPRWVTKDKNGYIEFWSNKPESGVATWYHSSEDTIYQTIYNLKLAEFEGKDWAECIYEVPRKEEPKDKIKIGTLYIDKNVTFGDGDDDDVGVALEDYEVLRKATGMIERLEPLDGLQHNWLDKINELVDAVNELKGAKND